MVEVIFASFVLIGIVCGFFVSILGFLAIVGIWLAVVALAVFAELVSVNGYLLSAAAAFALAQVGFLVGAVVSSKLRSLKLKMGPTVRSHEIEPGGKNVL